MNKEMHVHFFIVQYFIFWTRILLKYFSFTSFVHNFDVCVDLALEKKVLRLWHLGLKGSHYIFYGIYNKELYICFSYNFITEFYLYYISVMDY